VSGGTQFSAAGNYANLIVGNTWNHVATTQFTNKTAFIYVNAVQVGTSTAQVNTSIPSTNNIAYIGAYPTLLYTLVAYVDDLMIWGSTSLNASQVLTVMNFYSTATQVCIFFVYHFLVFSLEVLRSVKRCFSKKIIFNF
jgi:hypothetical protein